jgi:hypothetical protein
MLYSTLWITDFLTVRSFLLRYAVVWVPRWVGHCICNTIFILLLILLGDGYFLWCCTVLSGRSLSTFPRCVLPWERWVRVSEISVNLHQTTRCNIPEDCHLYTFRHKNLKYHTFLSNSSCYLRLEMCLLYDNASEGGFENDIHMFSPLNLTPASGPKQNPFKSYYIPKRFCSLRG